MTVGIDWQQVFIEPLTFCLTGLVVFALLIRAGHSKSKPGGPPAGGDAAERASGVAR